jgi:4-amino-4-deoxy-L-arabinose transferase-like glycosyltransferase
VEDLSATRREFPRPLLAVFAVALVVRLGLAVWFHGEPLQIHDERDYDALAVNLVRHGQFAFEPGVPTSLRPPLYPAFLAMIYKISGEQNHTAVRLVQVALSLATVWLVFLLARRVYDGRTALWAAGLFALYPSLLVATQFVLTETLFTLLLCLALLLLAHYLDSGGWRRLAALGVVLGLSALTRSVLWLFPPFLFLFLLWAGRSPRWPGRLGEAGIAIAAMCLTIAPWTARNTALQKTFTAVDVMGGRNFMMGNYEHTPFDRPWDAISMEGDEAWHSVLRKRYPQKQGLTQGQLDKLAMRYGIAYVLAHPLETAQRDLAKFFHFWQLEREIPAGLSRGYWGDLPKPAVIAISLVIICVYAATMLAGVAGLFLAPCRDRRMHVFLILLAGFVCAVHTAVFGHSRYHLPLMPIVMIFAAAAWSGRGTLLANWRTWPFAAACAVCFVLLAAWGRELVIEAGRF